MKIENEIFKFNPQINLIQLSDKMKWTDLQKQYLSLLTSENSIESMSEQLFKNGWLVNFQLLFNLISDLTSHKALLNINIIHYFSTTLNTSTQQSGFLNKNPQTIDSRIPSKSELDQIIAQNAFFRNLPLELSHLILKKSVIKKIKIDQAICKTGSTDRTMYILLSGQAAVYKLNPKPQFISMINPTGLFGESSFLLGTAKSADILAVQNCEVLEIPYDASILDAAIKKNTAEALIHRFWIQNSITNSAFFKKIPPDCLDALTFSGQIKKLKSEEILFKQNDISDAAYLVIQGQIKIIQNGQTISSMNQGQFFGEISLTMTNGKRTASAQSFGETTLLQINRQQFYKLLSQNLFLAKEIQKLSFSKTSKRSKLNLLN